MPKSNASPIDTSQHKPASPGTPTPSDERSDPAHTTPESGSRKPEADAAAASPAPGSRSMLSASALAERWLSPTFLHKHERRAAFETLLHHHLYAYAPATPQEQLLTFRITQKSWILRRLDKLERVIADSAVTRIQQKHPNAAPAACLATLFLEAQDTAETRFYDRLSRQRQQQEAAQERLEE